jgi:hypothetical protein
VLREDGVDDLPRVGRPPVGARAATQGASVGRSDTTPADLAQPHFPQCSFAVSLSSQLRDSVPFPTPFFR